VSAHGEVAAEVTKLRSDILKAGWTDPVGLVRRARDFLGAILTDEGREPTPGELVQIAALFTVAAEVQRVRSGQQDPTG